jgi:hypothetical protein
VITFTQPGMPQVTTALAVKMRVVFLPCESGLGVMGLLPTLTGWDVAWHCRPQRC